MAHRFVMAWSQKVMHDHYFKEAKAVECLTWAAALEPGPKLLVRSLDQEIGEVSVPPKYCDDRVKVLQADARTLTPEILKQYASEGFDSVISDMLQFTSGVNDVELGLELAGTAMHIATGHYYDLYGEEYAQQVGIPRHAGVLRPGGSLLMKIYEGQGTNEFIRDMQKYFTKVARMRVDASRSMSREFYAVGLGRKRTV